MVGIQAVSYGGGSGVVLMDNLNVLTISISWKGFVFG